MWYTIGSLSIPGIILLVISSYYPKLKVSINVAMIEIIGGVLISTIWFLLRNSFAPGSFIAELEPMIVGLVFVSLIHLGGIKAKNRG